MVVAVSFMEMFFRAVFAATVAVPVVLVALVVTRVIRSDFKFSLRSLMIVTTLLAIMLGLCVYVIRK